MMSRASLLLGAMLLASALAGCGTAFTSTKAAEPVLIATPASPAAVRAAIVRAMADRRFSAVAEAPGKISARLDKGDIQLHVDIEYSETQYLVRYVKSTGLDTRPGPGGEVLVDDHWERWVRGLRARIGEELQAPAKAAAEAARRDREYQLLLEQHKTAQAQANAQAAQPAPASPASPPVALPPGLPIPPGIPIPLPQLPAGGIELQHSTTKGSQTITCCINGALYACPSQEAFKQCMSLGPHECKREEGKSCK